MKLFLTLTTALIVAAPALADEHEARYRLFVADAEAPQITSLDVGHAERTVFDTASPARLYLGPERRHAWALQRQAGRVQLLDTGLVSEDHGDHSAIVLQAPAMMPGALAGEAPVHFNMDSQQVAIFWDGTGEATIHPANGALSEIARLETGAPHHGVAVPLGELSIITVAPQGEGLPDVLAVVTRDGQELYRIDCLNLHGEGKAASFIAFGCEDGVAIFDSSVSPPSARFLAYPEGAPEGGIIRSFLSPAETPALVGTFGADQIVVFDPASQAGDFLFTQLQADRMAFAIDEEGHYGFAILADGHLVRFSVLSGRILNEAAGVTAVYSMERGVVRPMMAVAGNRVAVSDPAAGQVVLLDAEGLEIVERIDLGGQPQSLLLLTAEAEHAH